MSVDGAVKALCDRLSTRSDTRTGKDLSEQCIKVKTGGGGGVNLILPHSSSQKRQNWDEVK